jgi:uncharacterized protein YndB with AHSA1/START domain
MNNPAPVRPRNPVVQAGWKLSLVFVAVIVAFVGAGLFLPGTWSAQATRVVGAPPDSVFALVGSPKRWDEWTPWPEIEFRYDGPAEGAGATRSWDAPRIGAGSFTITAAERPSQVDYQVALEGEAHATRGSFRMQPVGGGTQVTWREEGDFGSNPLMGWAARSMRRRHGGELEARLGALAERATRGTAAGAGPP